MTPSADPQTRSEFSSTILAFRRAFYAVGAFSFAVNVLLLVPAVYMLQIYDRVLTSRNVSTLAMLTLIVVALYILDGALEFVRSRVLIRTGAALDLSVSTRVFDSTFERYLRRRGSPTQPFSDLVQLRQFLTGKGVLAFFDAPWTVIYIAVIAVISPWLGGFAVVSALLLLALAWLNQCVTGERIAGAGALSASANHYAASHLRNAEAVEAMGMLPNLRARWLARQNGFLSLQADASDRAAWVGSATRFARLSLQSGILGTGALLVIDGQITPGGMIAASILLGRALSPVELAISTWQGAISARSAYDRLSQLLDDHPPRTEMLSLPRPDGLVRAEELMLGAPGGDSPILNCLSFEVPPGTVVAVVGPSASGKSTLARAVVGVWAPTSGAVRLDGAEVHKWNRSEVGQWIGYLPQDVELFEGTIADNIARFGEPDAEQIMRAAQRAGVHEMILRLPQGYDTPIGEGGAVLSGGQRQRVALARALYGDPALLVLDEPNANLDEAGNAALLAALRTLKEEKRTVFVITHHINVLRVADSVMVLAAGKLQVFGPRDEVLRAPPSRRAQAFAAHGTDVPPQGVEA